jgi:hypothetical protein
MHHTEEGALSGKRKKSPVLSEKKEKLVTGSWQWVRDMHRKKTMMARASDAFVAVLGSFGTMEELTHGSIDFNVEVPSNNDSINGLPSTVFELWPSQSKSISFNEKSLHSVTSD